MVTYDYIFFLGSHPTLSAVEAWEVLARSELQVRLLYAAEDRLEVSLSGVVPEDLLTRLGGSNRIAEVKATFSQEPSAQDLWQILDLTEVTKKKMTVGLSVVGIPRRQAATLGPELKKLAREAGRSLRFVTARGGGGQLNAAQVIFNTLTKAPHRELSIIKNNESYQVAQTVQIQDIQAYELRDTARPVRDVQVGMLPPKLAQMMLNLALSRLPQTGSQVILDPFCGMGTVLQEGWLWGHQMIGADISQKMVAASQSNLDWLESHFSVEARIRPALSVHDIQQAIDEKLDQSIDAIVTEPYLGEPISSPLSPTEADTRFTNLAILYLSAFRNMLPLLKKSGILLMALPAYRAERRRDDWHTLPQSFLDSVTDLGYSLEQLVPEELQTVYPPTARGSLTYARPDALVGRELFRWSKA